MSIFSGSLGGSHSSNSSNFSQNVWKPQGKALTSMYDSARHTFANQQPFIQQFRNFGMNTVNPFMAGLNPYMMQGFGGLMGGGAQGATGAAVDPGLRDSLMKSLQGGQSNTAKMYQDIVGGPGNTYIQPVIDDMYANAWQGLDRGGFKNSAQAAAQSGNMGNYSRQIDNSLLAADTMSDVRQKANALRAANYGRDMDWKMSIANQADANLGAAQDRALGLLGAGDQNMAHALGSGLGMQQFGMGMMNPWMAMMQAPWMNMNNYANVLGDPTVLGKGNSEGSSWGFDTSGSFM